MPPVARLALLGLVLVAVATFGIANLLSGWWTP